MGDACRGGDAQQVPGRAPKEIQHGIVLERWGIRNVDYYVGSGQRLFETFACEAVDAGRRRSRRQLMSARLQLGCKLATDQAGPAYDDDFH